MSVARHSAGQQQALGPPPGGPELAGAPNTSLIQFGPTVDMTASLIVGDRSREGNEEPAKPGASMESSKGILHEEVVILAGPMKDWDPLYMLLIILALLTCVCTVCAIFLPYAFTVRKPFATRIDKSFSMFDSKPCSSFNDESTERAKDICYKASHVLGSWVVVMQAFACIGLALSVIALIMQLINICLNPRNKVLHLICLYLMTGACISFLVSGHIGHNRGVWTDPLVLAKDVEDVQVGTVISGLLLLSTTLTVWSCVISHITSHGPGPLSKDTRFAHTFSPLAKAPSTIEPVSGVRDVLIQEYLKEEPPETPMDDRRGSNLSTEV
ncbi:hypothetical protein ACOMHN_001519 [Nucella lapillus]